jgi:serine/threonine-protein kinase RIM15
VFQVATQSLRDDDSHTVEVRFYLRIEPFDERDDPNSMLYQLMEGKGMMMADREVGLPSHTMWVIKPCGPPEYLQPSIYVEDDGDVQHPSAPSVERSPDDQHDDPPMPLPFARPINVTPILCRICENSIPQWYFEKHNETCSETHRLEAEIGECNESISELRNTIRDISTTMDRSSPVTPPEYRGLPILSPSSSPVSSSPLQLFRINRMQRFGVKRMQRRLLEQLDDTLQVALEISVPTMKEDEAKEPIERQRLLSPSSERKITQIRNWLTPTTSDSGLGQLVQDTERVMRQKIDTVVRLQNTIRYSEKVRREWEERVAQALADEEDDEGSVSDSDEESPGETAECYEPNLQAEDDRSSTTSEYAFGGSGSCASPDPTPLASTPPIPAVPSTEKMFSVISSAPQPLPPVAYAWQGLSMQTRSSTPSSVSSPLALAAPIIASDTPGSCNPPHMDLNDSILKTVRPRKSGQNLDAAQQMSPLNSPSDLPGARRSHRRHSTINPVLSPVTLPISAGPASPRLPSATPLSRATPTSIKDFEVIKPISKGAFGSVFLAKKKATGDYYAIKVLKKADMIAKNQITNVKAERMILMKQAESPFVAKLYFTFQSKENLYLVMEYLNGGDCAALIKSLGALPEEWAKNYVAAVVLGLEYLHQRGIIHRYVNKPSLLVLD